MGDTWAETSPACFPDPFTRKRLKLPRERPEQTQFFSGRPKSLGRDPLCGADRQRHLERGGTGTLGRALQHRSPDSNHGAAAARGQRTLKSVALRSPWQQETPTSRLPRRWPSSPGPAEDEAPTAGPGSPACTPRPCPRRLRGAPAAAAVHVSTFRVLSCLLKLRC